MKANKKDLTAWTEISDKILGAAEDSLDTRSKKNKTWFDDDNINIRDLLAKSQNIDNIILTIKQLQCCKQQTPKHIKCGESDFRATLNTLLVK